MNECDIFNAFFFKKFAAFTLTFNFVVLKK